MLLHAHRRHSILLFTLALAALGGATVAQAESSSFFGRWTVSDDKPAYTAKGRLYKTMDVARCGADFCGVSVSDKGECGATLFRFLAQHGESYMLQGHGLWGETKVKLQIEYHYPREDVSPPNDKGPDGPTLLLGIGDTKFDFETRDGSLPEFEANYLKTGDAKCVAGGHTS